MEASDTGSLSQHVYTGFWVNKAYKSPYGATLTLSRQTGGFLIAFLAIYVGFVGTSVWNIVRFCLHVKFSSRLRPDGIYHQRQVLLKNARTAPEAVVDSFQLFWAWRNRSKESVWRLFSVATVAATVASAFAVASKLRFRCCFKRFLAYMELVYLKTSISHTYILQVSSRHVSQRMTRTKSCCWEGVAT